MVLLPEVRAGWCAFTMRFEGRISWLYLDVRGLVTTGLGCLVDPVELALPLPWWSLQQSSVDQGVIREEWARVKALPRGQVAWRYRDPRGLRLHDEAIDALALGRLDADAAELAHFFPELGTYPAPVQQALMSMCWALGPGFPAHWPHLSAAVRARDWDGAAAEGNISAVNNPGVIARNAANARLFRSAILS